jgi:hypothetical protein
MTKNQEPKHKGIPQAISKAASALGKRGGRAGYEAGLAGRSPKKHSEHSRNGVTARWDRYYESIFERLVPSERCALDDVYQHRYVVLSMRTRLLRMRLIAGTDGACALAPTIADRWPAWRANHPN